MHIPFFPTGKDKKLPKFNLLVYNKNIISIDQEKEKIAIDVYKRQVKGRASLKDGWENGCKPVHGRLAEL